MDAASQRWLDDLAVAGPARDEAVARLHDLLAAGGAERARAPAAHSPPLRGGDHDDLAQQCAADALVAVLAKLPQFRGESLFTTWAYRFALYEAAAGRAAGPGTGAS